MQMKSKIGFLISHSDNYYSVELGLHTKALQELEAFAEELGCETVSYGPIKTGEEAVRVRSHFDSLDIDYLVMFIADFTAGDVMTAFEGVSYPVGIWFPKEPHTTGDILLNAVVTANMFASIAQRTYKEPLHCDWYYGDIHDPLVQERLRLNLTVARAKRSIEHATVGILGDVAPTFFNLENHRLPEFFPLMNFLHFNMEQLRAEVARVTEQELAAAKALIRSSCDHMEASEKSLDNSARVYVALKNYLTEHHVDCLAAACWPDFQDEFKIVPCVIYSLLGSELNIPVACEGDIGGAISLLMAKEVSGAVPTLMDLTGIKPETGSLLLWHCGIGSKDLAPETGVKIINHPMLDRKNPNRELMGLSYDYHFKPEALTVLRYSNNGKLLSFQCSVEPSLEGYSGTRGYLNGFTGKGQPFSAADVMDTIFRNGIEHHLIVCPGSIEAALTKLAERMNIPVIEIERYQA